MAADFNPLREKHYSVLELATIWNVSDDLVRRLFRSEPDVVHITEHKPGRRRYEVLRIPESVALRVYRRMGNEWAL